MYKMNILYLLDFNKIKRLRSIKRKNYNYSKNVSEIGRHS